MTDPLAEIESINQIPIRITAERWTHVTENHDYMAVELDRVIESIEDPDMIVPGNRDELIVLKHYKKTSKGFSGDRTMIDRDQVLDAVQDFLKFLSKQIWMDYDEEADVLYINFRKPQNADDSEMKDDIVYYYDEDKLVGLTILNARDRSDQA